MPTVDIYNIDKEKVAEVALEDNVFGVEVREHLLYAAVRYQMAKRRAGTHKVKSRAEVSGGGRKPFKQKGTGRARAGTIRSPIWRGGGIVHGPTPRSHAFKLNKKVRALALKSALSRRVEENKLLVISSLELPEIKTQHVASLLKRFELDDALVVLAGRDDVFERSARNLAKVTVVPSDGVNVYDVLLRKNLVMTQEAVEALTSRLGS